MGRRRMLCFVAAAVLWAAGLAGVLTLGALIKVNIALMLIAFGSGFFVLGLVLGTRRPASMQ